MRVTLELITPGAEEFILKVARVSSDDTNKDAGLLRYLVAHSHWSPLEHAHATFKITTARAISAQLLRHRSFAFQEVSQRYTDADHAIIFPGRRQAAKNRQSSVDDLDEETQTWWREQQETVQVATQTIYLRARERGIARESARMILPLATETDLYMTGSIRSWVHYIAVRAQDDTQLEHREIAVAIRERLALEIPTIAEAMGW